MTYQTVEITGTYQYAVISVGEYTIDLNGAYNYLNFTPTSDLVDSTTGIVYKAISTRSSVSGEIEPVTLITTDSTDLVPLNAISGEAYTWLWKIDEVFANQNPYTWWAQIPSTLAVEGVIDLSKLTRLPAPTIG